MIQRTALVGHLETDAHLSRILPEYFLICHDNESGGVGPGLIHPPLQHLQTIDSGGMLAGHCGLSRIPVLRHLSGRKGIVQHTDLLPAVLRQIF